MYEIQIDGSWRGLMLPADRVEHAIEVINAFLVVQAGVSYTQAQGDIRQALGLT